MDISALTGVDPDSSVAQAYAARTDQLANDQDKANGQAAVALIQAASGPPRSPDGKGALLDIHA